MYMYVCMAIGPTFGFHTSTSAFNFGNMTVSYVCMYVCVYVYMYDCRIDFWIPYIHVGLQFWGNDSILRMYVCVYVYMYVCMTVGSSFGFHTST